MSDSSQGALFSRSGGRKLIYLLGSNGRRHIVPVVMAFLLLAVLDIAGISLAGPFLLAIIDPDYLASGEIWGYSSEFIATATSTRRIVLIGSLLGLAFLCKAVLAVFVYHYVVTAAFRIQGAIRMRLLQAFQKLTLEQYAGFNSSKLLTTVYQHTVYFTNQLLIPLLKGCAEAIFMVSLLLFLLLTNPFATISLVFVLIVFLIFYDRVVRRRLMIAGKKILSSGQDIAGTLTESANGFKEIRVLQVEGYFEERLRRANRAFQDASISSYTLKIIPRYLLEVVIILFMLSFVFVHIFSTLDATTNLMSTIGIFGFAAVRSLASLNTIATALSEVRVSAQSMFELYDELARADETLAAPSAGSAGAPIGSPSDIVLPESFQSLTLTNISYRYPGATRDALSEVSLTIRAGDSIGLIGRSGAGKTTLVDLMIGLLQPQRGHIELNAKTTAFLGDSWRARIAYIPQNVSMHDDTIRRNIAFGVPPGDIDDRRVQVALLAAQLADVVQDLPQGLDTLIGERGVRLSGGQRQRIALARAFYHERDVIIMDEATAALDNETERQVVESIRALQGRKTIIVIAHRLTTVRDCHRIYQLEGGKVVKAGRYVEVIGDRSGSSNES